MSLNITKDNFESEVLKSDVPVLVDFWAPWCGPCKMLGPVIDSFADEVKETAKVAKVNIDEEAALAVEYQIMSVPTLIVFKDGEIVQKASGVQSKDALKALINV